MILGTCGELLFWPVRQTMFAEIQASTHRRAYMAANALVYRVAMTTGPLGIPVNAVSGSFGNTAPILAGAGLSIALLFHVGRAHLA